MSDQTPMEMLREWDRLTESPQDRYWPEQTLVRLRMRLIKEEYEEARQEFLGFLGESSADGDRPALAKELADILYVVYGTGSAFGIDLDEALRRVHESNLSKLIAGKVVKDDGGKVLKGPNYKPPNMDDFGPVNAIHEEDPDAA